MAIDSQTELHPTTIRAIEAMIANGAGSASHRFSYGGYNGSRYCVYFAQQGNSGPIKIGSAFNPVYRVKSLQTGNPQRLYLRAVVVEKPAYRQVLERPLHELFEDYRIRGEWFRPVPELLQLIEWLAARAQP